MTSTELEKTAKAELVAALQSEQLAEIDSDVLQVPLLKIAQPLTREVNDGLASAGEFVNSLTGESIGDKTGFVLSWYQKGRFAADRAPGGRSYVAFSSTIPDAWGDLVGEEFVGTRFDEHPDAEETYKERVRAGEIEWGHGPLISTTHNFTGFVIVPPEEDDEEGESSFEPVRIALKRTDVPMARKFVFLAFRQKPSKAPWDFVYDLSTRRRDFTAGPAYLVEVKRGRSTTPEERQAAVELATLTKAGRVGDNSTTAANADTPVEPAAEGGLGL